MHLHRTLIATAITVGTVAGALIAGGQPSSPTSAARPEPTSLRPPTASAVVEVPSGAAPLDADLSPPDSDSPVATGAEAARWLEEAPPSVRQDVADNVGRRPEELTQLFLDDPTAFLSTDGMVGYIDPAPPDPRADEPGTTTTTHSPANRPTRRKRRRRPRSSRALGSVPGRRPRAPLAAVVDQGHLSRLRRPPDAERVLEQPVLDRPVRQPGVRHRRQSVRVLRAPNGTASSRSSNASPTTTPRSTSTSPRRIPGIDGPAPHVVGRHEPTASRVVITSSDWYAAANGGTRIGGIALLDVFTSSTANGSYVFSREPRHRKRQVRRRRRIARGRPHTLARPRRHVDGRATTAATGVGGRSWGRPTAAPSPNGRTGSTRAPTTPRRTTSPRSAHAAGTEPTITPTPSPARPS